MQWSRMFLPTLRESPAGVDSPGRRLLLRAGYLRQTKTGADAWLPLGQRSLAKIAALVREELNQAGGQEMLLPGDRAAVAQVARGGVRSHRQLPQRWYSVRDGVLGEAWSFDLDDAALSLAFERMRQACRRTLTSCGLPFLEAPTFCGVEFLMRSDAGGETMAECPACAFHATLENGSSDPAPPPLGDDADGDRAPERFHTPAVKSIAELRDFTGLPETSFLKTLAMVADGQPAIALLRGDDQLSETKFAAASGASVVRPALAEELRGWFGADAGSLGPVGVKGVRVLADEALRNRRNMICGANVTDYHLRGVTPGKDFEAGYFPLRRVKEGDLCPRCGRPLAFYAAHRLAQISRLGAGPAEAAGLHVSNDAGVETAVAMGSSSIAIHRLLECAAECFEDADGLMLPPSIAPFDVIITPVNIRDTAQQETAESLYAECRREGLDALFDDRDERPGVKFRDADLIGVPWRITVGRRAAEGIVEIMERRAKSKQEKPVTAAPALVNAEIAAQRNR